jgi:hypothetical protein
MRNEKEKEHLPNIQDSDSPRVTVGPLHSSCCSLSPYVMAHVTLIMMVVGNSVREARRQHGHRYKVGQMNEGKCAGLLAERCTRVTQS